MSDLADRPRPGGATALTELAATQEGRLIKTLRRGDIVLFIVAAVISVDTIGVMASGGPEGLLWAIFLAGAFLVPSAMIFAETGGAFTEEGGPYQWVKYAFGRGWAAVAVVLYWITNPIWLGGSLVFITSEVWNEYVFGIEPGSLGDYLFKLVFIWVAIGLAIVSLQKGKFVISAGAIAKLLVLISLVTTAVIYGLTHGFEPITLSSLTPTTGGFLAIVPIALFAYLGFEAPNSAAGEMHNPQKDVPAAIRRGSVITMLAYVLPVLAILWATPAEDVADAGVMAALESAYSVYGPAAGFLTVLTALLFAFALLTQGSAWMMATDRMQAMAAADGSFFGGFFGEFHEKLGTPVRMNILSGVVSTVFAIAAMNLVEGTTASVFVVVLTVAVSTLLISYLIIIPAIMKLRAAYPDVVRPYSVPGGATGFYVLASVVLGFIALGSWVAVFPGTIENLFGLEYSFADVWGVSQLNFEVFTVGTLIVVILIAVIGYHRGRGVRAAAADTSSADQLVTDTTDSEK
jgi:amino acid transporter